MSLVDGRLAGGVLALTMAPLGAGGKPKAAKGCATGRLSGWGVRSGEKGLREKGEGKVNKNLVIIGTRRGGGKGTGVRLLGAGGCSEMLDRGAGRAGRGVVWGGGWPVRQQAGRWGK